MQSAKHIEKTTVPPQATTQKGETKENVQPSELKLSSEKIYFQHKKTGNQPGMPQLSPMERGVCGCQNPMQAPFQETSLDRVRESTRRFRESLMYTVPGAVREQAVDTLNLLIRFDKSVSMEESRVLMDAVKIITAKGLPS
jgi:hypothetical protein